MRASPTHTLAYIPTGTTEHTLKPKLKSVSGAAARTEVPYLQRELVGWPPNPVLGLHTVLPGQGYSRMIETPVFLSFQLQEEDLQRATEPRSVSELPDNSHGRVVLED